MKPNLKFLKACLAVLLVGGMKYGSAESAPIAKLYSARDRQIEEERIRKDIEEKLDWRNRTKETLDDYDDAHRMLYGTLNESILLRQVSGERFGVFESIQDNGEKSFEIRLHKKNKLTDRFFLFGDGCEGVSIHAEKVTPEFIVYETGCSVKNRNNSIEEKFDQYLFDYSSRNFYLLAFLDYDSIENKPPRIKLENGVYKMRWSVKLRGKKKNVLVVRNFKVLKDEKGEWIVKELPPIDEEAAGISPLRKLPLKREYDLPSFVADWGKY